MRESFVVCIPHSHISHSHSNWYFGFCRFSDDTACLFQSDTSRSPAGRRGAAGRCSTAVREVPGSNPGSEMDVVFFRCWFSVCSVSCYCRLEPEWIAQKSLSYQWALEQIELLLYWLTVTITKSNRSSNCHFSCLSFQFKLHAILRLWRMFLWIQKEQTIVRMQR